MNVYNHDTVRDVAESLGITSINDEVAKNLAQDVEYRIHAIIQEASKFMRHAKRTTLRTTDISHALRVLNVEPLYGFAANKSVTFREAPLAPGQPPLYYMDDEEVEFEKIVNAPLPKVPRDVTYTAHWLAVEGVQPAIPQNPAPDDAKTEFGQTTNTTGAEVTVKPLVKHVLSKELVLYFERIVKAALDEFNDPLRTAAIASLRNDPGLHQLLPYLIQFVAEKVTHNLKNLFVLETMMQIVWALLDNSNLFVEPYIHQLMPPVLTCLIAKKLGGSYPADAAPTAHFDLRDLAASILQMMCERYGQAYTTLKPRVTKTLLKAFLDNKKPLATHYGAIVGLTKMGPEVVRILVLPNAKIYELVLKPELESIDEVTRLEAEKCLAALQYALESIRDEEVVVKVEIPDEESTRATLQERIGLLLTDYLLEKHDEALLRVILST